MRIPNKELAVIDAYAVAHDLSRAQSMLHFIRQGIGAETGERPATKSDLVALATTIQKAIQTQPIAIQEAVAPQLPDAEQHYERIFFGLYRKKKD